MNKLKLLSLLTVSALAGCDGDNGRNGIDGNDGVDGQSGAQSLIVQTDLALGDANCPNTGVRVDSGVDADFSGTLDSNEISDTKFICTPGISQLKPADVLNNVNNPWYLSSSTAVDNIDETVSKIVDAKGKAKNIILFIGDGMGVSTVTAARILEGQQKGMMGEENQLSFGKFPFSGLAKTYNVDAQTPDSAGTMTAMVSGLKTDVGTIGVDEDIVGGEQTTEVCVQMKCIMVLGAPTHFQQLYLYRKCVTITLDSKFYPLFGFVSKT